MDTATAIGQAYRRAITDVDTFTTRLAHYLASNGRIPITIFQSNGFINGSDLAYATIHATPDYTPQDPNAPTAFSLSLIEITEDQAVSYTLHIDHGLTPANIDPEDVTVTITATLPQESRTRLAAAAQLAHHFAHATTNQHHGKRVNVAHTLSQLEGVRQVNTINETTCQTGKGSPHMATVDVTLTWHPTGSRSPIELPIAMTYIKGSSNAPELTLHQ